MHAHLLAIRDLWHVDEEMDALRARARALARAVEEARARREAAREALAARQAELADLQERERALERRIAEYGQRRDRTRMLLDQGKVGDFISAQRQLDQCIAIVDEAETELLELLERIDAASEALARAEAEAQAAERAVEAAVRAQAEERPAVVARYRELEALRPERWAALDEEHRVPYQDLRRRGWRPLAWIRDGACEECRRVVPPQMAIEVVQGRAVHRCRGCGRFLYDVRPTEETEEDES